MMNEETELVASGRRNVLDNLAVESTIHVILTC